VTAGAPGVLGASDPESAAYGRVAREILGEARFRPAPLPHPLRGVLEAIGNAFAPVGHAVARAFAGVAGVVPGGGAAVWVVLSAAIVAIAVVVATRLTGRKLVDRAAGAARRGGDLGAPDAAALEAAADAAEREGRSEQAVRLRFQAGLLRLDEIGVLTYRPSLPNAAVARRLGSATFDGLLRRFEEVVYGGRTAEPADARSAREGWREVLARAARR
jgi:hypothetical protein